jgi:hypothetical protein
MLVCLEIINTPDHPYRASFMVASGNLANEEFIPAHIGEHGQVRIDETGGGTFNGGLLAKSKDEILSVIQCPSLYTNAKRWYWIEDGQLFHSGSAARIYYPSFTKNDSACQSHEAYTAAVIVGAVGFLAKDGALSGDEFYKFYLEQFDAMRAEIRGGARVIPEAQMFERADNA